MLDEIDGPEGVAVDEISRLYHDREFTILLPYSVKREIENPNTPIEVQQRAANLVYTNPVELTDAESVTHGKIRALIQGNAKAAQHDSDAFHLVESAKYGRFFITNDKRLLKKAAEIWEELTLGVVRPSEFLEIYHQTPTRRSVREPVQNSKGKDVMSSEYLSYQCRTCGGCARTKFSAVEFQDGRYLLRCTKGHKHTYEEKEIEREHLESSSEILKKFGLD